MQGTPGDDDLTLLALDAVPGRDVIRQVLELGTGRGRTNSALTQALRDARITAVDIHEPFVERMNERVREAGLDDRVQSVFGDMGEIDVAEGSIDLI